MVRRADGTVEDPSLAEERGTCGEHAPCFFLHMQSAPFACCYRCYLERLVHILEGIDRDG